jgi:alpha-beta hydrolase superfamily lysophospholipase
LCQNRIAALALDMHGHGESQGGRWHVDIAEWTGDLGAGLDFLEARAEIDGARIGAFGFSSGGTAVLEAALEDPRIKAIVTLAATVRNEANLFLNAVLRLLVGLGKLKQALRGKELRVSLLGSLSHLQLAFDPKINQEIAADPRLRAAYSSIPFPGSGGCYFVDTLARARAIRVPTLVLHGEEDRLDPPESARRLYARLGGEKSLRIIPRSGHFAHVDGERELVLALIVDWMRAHLP